MRKVDFPLTRFICNMMNATNEQISRANPKKMAAHYGISEKHCEEQLNWEKMMRGMPRNG